MQLQQKAMTKTHGEVQLRVQSQKSPLRTLTYFLFAPSVLLVLAFSYYPALRSIVGSLTSWDGFNPPQFVGFQNYVQYFTNPVFPTELRNLGILVFGGILISLIFPFMGAELLYHLYPRWLQGVVKYLLVIPMVIPVVVVINVWAYLLNPSDGLIDGFLSLFHVPAVQWFSDPKTALLSILLIGFPWVSGLGFLIFLAGIQGISFDIFDAAKIDGASVFRRIRQIDLPLIIPQIRFVVVIVGVAMVQNFIPILLLTDGGPGNATMVPGLDMYQSAFASSEYGYGMAIGTLLFIGLLIFTFLVLRFLKPRT
ncbi:MAG: sugar ABC transporter permease [Firmicutes bacterium]|nr:sugar ABC transporter permease [Bacillota bacterium]